MRETSIASCRRRRISAEAVTAATNGYYKLIGARTHCRGGQDTAERSILARIFWLRRQ